MQPGPFPFRVLYVHASQTSCGIQVSTRFVDQSLSDPPALAPTPNPTASPPSGATAQPSEPAAAPEASAAPTPTDAAAPQPSDSPASPAEQPSGAAATPASDSPSPAQAPADSTPAPAPSTGGINGSGSGQSMATTTEWTPIPGWVCFTDAHMQAQAMLTGSIPGASTNTVTVLSLLLVRVQGARAVHPVGARLCQRPALLDALPTSIAAVSQPGVSSKAQR